MIKLYQLIYLVKFIKNKKKIIGNNITEKGIKELIEVFKNNKEIFEIYLGSKKYILKIR
jgi:hypothetical protein